MTHYIISILQVLQCFHSFCQACLEKVQDHPDRVSCPLCHLETPLGSGGVAGLLSDYGMTGLLDNITGPQTGIDFGATFCTGCKSREGAPAVARCLTCATFLCPNCVMAHKVFLHFFIFEKNSSNGNEFTIFSCFLKVTKIRQYDFPNFSGTLRLLYFSVYALF